MKIKQWMEGLQQIGIEQYYGVPDSTLEVFCDTLNTSHEIGHMIAANEGAAIGLAAGYYLAMEKPACVYMQNSGIGNAVNPICSLLHKKVYDIPVLLVIGYRGEPGIHDEPQHIFQGEVTISQLDLLEIPYAKVNAKTNEQDFAAILKQAKIALDNHQSFALVVSKGTFESEKIYEKSNGYSLVREEAISCLVDHLHDEVVFSTTGKISRELYEQLEAKKHDHSQAFLTVGSMGHASMIALGYAKCFPNRKVICLDGDGACLMHLGALATIGHAGPKNYIHIVLNNAAHESVGGMPTCDPNISLAEVAKTLGYVRTYQVDTKDAFIEIMKKLDELEGPVLVEVMVSLISRKDLGRPKESARENKEQFIAHFKEDNHA